MIICPQLVDLAHYLVPDLRPRLPPHQLALRRLLSAYLHGDLKGPHLLLALCLHLPQALRLIDQFHIYVLLIVAQLLPTQHDFTHFRLLKTHILLVLDTATLREPVVDPV
jgi:hypothetical protein